MAATEERPVVDLFDVVQPVCSEGSANLHLAPYDWDRGVQDSTLCDLAVSEVRPEKTYLRDGCVQCATRASSAGIYAVRESVSSVVNLGRFIDSHMPPDPV